ncbi:hypothetical protein Tco_0825379 [Tanacetum coccineum]
MVTIHRLSQNTTQSKQRGFSQLKANLDYSSEEQQDGKDKLVKSSTLIGSLMPRGLKEAQEMMILTLDSLREKAQGVLTRIAKLAIRLGKSSQDFTKIIQKDKIELGERSGDDLIHQESPALVIRALAYCQSALWNFSSTADFVLYKAIKSKRHLSQPKVREVPILVSLGCQKHDHLTASWMIETKVATGYLRLQTHILGGTKRISDKRTKNEAKNDKTGHGVEKRGKAKSKPKSTKVKVKVNPDKSTIKTGADTEEYLMGLPEPI